MPQPVNLACLIPIFHELQLNPIHFPGDTTLGNPARLMDVSLAIDHNKGLRAQLFFEACKMGRIALVCLMIQSYPESCTKLSARGLYFASLYHTLAGHDSSGLLDPAQSTLVVMETLVTYYPTLLDDMESDGDLDTVEDVVLHLSLVRR